MYFVTGGSFNGKSRWVKTHFNLSKADTTWLSLFEGNIHQLNEWNVSKPFIVIEGLEYGVRSSLLMNEPDFRQSFSMMLDSLSRWEEEHYERKIIWIGSEIGKGIVPMDKFSRGLERYDRVGISRPCGDVSTGMGGLVRPGNTT
ncbi:hypothetical protein QTG56_15470 [Rossellomorea sp. AcN35-11]|nr:hypothetical protein QTG56_15470 [Rossellomorea sp. AcN35-11]